MITPTRRAVLLTAAGALPALLVGVFAPPLWQLGLMWVPIVLMLLLLDWATAARGPTLEVQCPGAVEVASQLIVDVTIHPHGSFPTALELAIGTGPRLRAAGKNFVSVSPGETRVTFAFQPERRGRDAIERLWCRWTGPLGLARCQREHVIGRTIVITPDMGLVRDTAALLLRDQQQGEMARIDRGEGSEFEALTEWQSGMERRSIDWRQSARHRQLLARETRIERNNQIVLAIDAGRVMCEPVGGLPRVDRAISAALLAAYAALKLGDRVSLFGFDSKPRISSGAVTNVRGFPLLQRLAGELDYSTVETNYTLALATLTGGLSRRSLVVVFTEFTDQTAAEMMIRAAAHLLDRHLVLFVVLADEELEDIVAAEPLNVDDVSHAVVAASLLRERRLVTARMRSLGIHVLEAPYDRLGPALVRQYLEFKRRNLL